MGTMKIQETAALYHAALEDVARQSKCTKEDLNRWQVSPDGLSTVKVGQIAEAIHPDATMDQIAFGPEYGPLVLDGLAWNQLEALLCASMQKAVVFKGKRPRLNSTGGRIKFARNYMTGLTQEQLAERVKTSRSTVESWEAGTNVPQWEKMVTLSLFTGISIEFLYRGGPVALSTFNRSKEQVKALEALKDWYRKENLDKNHK